MSKATKTNDVVEIHFCENCDKETKWESLGWTNASGFAFISCEGCGITSVENADGQEDPFRI